MVIKNKRKSDLRDIRKPSILRTLSGHGAQPFNDLQRLTNYSPSTLSSLLKDLKSEGKIEQILHQGKSAYTITKKGKGTIIELGILGVEATEIMQKGGIYHDDYSNEYGGMLYYWQLSWGIQDDIVYDKSLQKLNPISKDTARAVNELLYHCIKEDVRKRKVRLDTNKDGKIILGLTIDYQDLVKSINEQSMYYLENMSKKEHDLFNRVGDRTMNNSEKEELEQLRKQTKAKIGVRIR